MAKEDTSDLSKFLDPFPEEVQKIAFCLRDFVWDQYPKANELIYDNYNAVAFGWSITDRLGSTFCTIAVGRSSHNVHFGFYHGAELSDPDGILIGQGNQYRYILVKDIKDFPKTYIKKLLKEAYTNALSKIKPPLQSTQGQTFTKSISPAKRSAPKSKKK